MVVRQITLQQATEVPLAHPEWTNGGGNQRPTKNVGTETASKQPATLKTSSCPALIP